VQGFLTGRDELRGALGLPPGTSDADLVAASVERQGAAAAARRLGGSCAWIVWEPAHGTLTACRDRLGLQPLFHAQAGDRLALGPGARAAAVAAGLTPEPDLVAVAAHVQGRFAPPDRGYLRGVAAVPPAHLLEVSAAGGFRVQRYWCADAGGPAVPAAAAAGEVGNLLRTVVAETLPETGFALTLSSGLDSGTLALYWRRTHPEADLDAVLWAAPELPNAEEAPRARRVARTLGLREHAVRADLRWPLSRDGEPLGRPDSPFVPFYAEVWEETFRCSRGLGATGLATGAGGDHLFGYGGFGAYTYVDLLATGRWRELAKQVRSHHRVSPASLARILDLDLLRPLAHLLLPAARPWRRAAVPWLGEALRGELRHLGPATLASSGGGLPGRRHRLAVLTDPGHSTLLAELGERARRHGLELRHPLLDHRLFELAARLPSESCFRAGYYKVVLRDLLRGHLPDEVVERRDKVSPEAIFDRGLRERQTAQVEALLTGMEAARRGWVDEAALRCAYARYRGDGRGGSRIWFALTLEHWLRRYF
jgi:asparagine synthase (glutamine-hydrolysing)